VTRATPGGHPPGRGPWGAGIALLLAALGGCGERPPEFMALVDEARAALPVGKQAALLDCREQLGRVPEAWEPVAATLCSELFAQPSVGVAIAVVEDGRLVWSAGAGRRCVDDRDPPRGRTPFRIGSITKIATAMTVVALADAGVLALTDPLERWLPELVFEPAAQSRAITLAQLLQHTAGLPEIEPSARTGGLERDELIVALAGARLRHPPGELYAYSNLHYVLLGAVIERATGRPFARVAEERALVPAALRTWEFDPAAARDPSCGHLTDPLGPAGRGFRPLAVTDDLQELAHGARWTIPAGGALASAEQLALLPIAAHPRTKLDTLRLIGGALAEPVPTHERSGEAQAIGWKVQELPRGRHLVHHTGRTGTFTAEVWAIPELRHAVAIVANHEREYAATRLAALTAMGVELAQDGDGAPLDGGAYVGEYSDPAGHMLTVTADSSGLFLRTNPRGQPRLLRHVDAHTFVAAPASDPNERAPLPERITFVPDRRDAARIRWLRRGDDVAQRRDAARDAATAELDALADAAAPANPADPSPTLAPATDSNHVGGHEGSPAAPASPPPPAAPRDAAADRDRRGDERMRD
jgi:CubicO group peptidase (beta-lactamase class C family)